MVVKLLLTQTTLLCCNTTAATPLLPTPFNLPQPFSHSVSHGLQATIITKILVTGVVFMEDGILIIVAISIMVLTDITLVKILTVIVLGLDSLLYRILATRQSFWGF
jgi:hypothetical protein